MQGGERVVGHLGASGRNRPDQRALASIGQAQQADIGDHAQFQSDVEFLTLFTLGALARGAVGR